MSNAAPRGCTRPATTRRASRPIRSPNVLWHSSQAHLQKIIIGRRVTKHKLLLREKTRRRACLAIAQVASRAERTTRKRASTRARARFSLTRAIGPRSHYAYPRRGRALDVNSDLNLSDGADRGGAPGDRGYGGGHRHPGVRRISRWRVGGGAVKRVAARCGTAAHAPCRQWVPK